MFYFIHVLAGATIAKFFPNLIPIILLSLIFHFLIDIIPHRDTFSDRKFFREKYKTKITKKVISLELADASISILLIIYILSIYPTTLMATAIFFSLLPDITRIGYLTRLKNNKLFKKYMMFHSKIQTDTSWATGIIIQLTIALVLFKLLI